MTIDNPSWRHHYLPQFYLRGFANLDSKVWQTFVRADGQLVERPLAPKQVGYEKNLYSFKKATTFDPELKVPDVIEKRFFQSVDNDAANALKHMLAATPSALSPKERRDWAIFMNALLERIPRQLQARDAVALQVAVEQRSSFLANRADTPESELRWSGVVANLSLDAAAGNAVREFMVREIQDAAVIAYFTGMTWIKTHVDVSPELEFLTGDAPVVVNLGGERPIQVMSLSLTPQDLLIMSAAALPSETLGNIALTHNLSVLAQSTQAYSRSPLHDGQLIKTRRAAQSSLVYRGRVSDGR